MQSLDKMEVLGKHGSRHWMHLQLRSSVVILSSLTWMLPFIQISAVECTNKTYPSLCSTSNYRYYYYFRFLFSKLSRIPQEEPLLHHIFTGQMLFLLPNEWHQSTEGKNTETKYSKWITNTGTHWQAREVRLDGGPSQTLKTPEKWAS